MKGDIQDGLDRLFSGQRRQKKSKSASRKMSTKSTLILTIGAITVGLGGVGAMAVYQASQLQEEQLGIAPGSAKLDHSDSGSETMQVPDAFRQSYSERTSVRFCNGDPATIPLSWSDANPSPDSIKVMGEIVSSLSDTATRDEIIAVVAKSMAASRLTNPENSEFRYPGEVDSIGSVASSDDRSGTFMMKTTPSNWGSVMNPGRSAKEQLEILRETELKGYSESITPMASSSASFTNMASMLLASYGIPPSNGSVDCIPVSDDGGDNPYQVVSHWIGQAAAPGSGSDVLGPTLAHNRESGPPSFSGFQLARYGVRQATGKSLPNSIYSVLAMESTEDTEGAVAISMNNGKPSMIGISSGDGEVVIADERSGFIKAISTDQFGDEVEYR